MEKYFPEAQVTGYQTLIPAMTNHPKDRHVVAAAVKAGAQVIATANLKDFASLPDAIEAQSPDHFLCNLFDLDQLAFIEMLREQAAASGVVLRLAAPFGTHLVPGPRITHAPSTRGRRIGKGQFASTAFADPSAPCFPDHCLSAAAASWAAEAILAFSDKFSEQGHLLRKHLRPIVRTLPSQA